MAGSPANITGLGPLLNIGDRATAIGMEKKLTSTAPPESDEVGQLRRQLDQISKEMGPGFNFDNIEGAPSSGSGSAVRYLDDYDDGAPPQDNMADYSYAPPPRASTEEQKRQNVLNAVLGASAGFSVEQAREEDDKLIYLEEIDSLRQSLKEQNINISNVPMVDYNTPMPEIRKCHRMLRLKNDTRRYRTLAEDMIMAGAYGLEWAFDGKKEYLGHKPDLTGWPATVRMKLMNMRYDTAMIVSDAIRDYDMGSGARLALELVPSMFLYSKMRNSQHGDTLTAADVDRATDNISTLAADASDD